MINREMDYKQKYILRNVANWYFVAPKYMSYNYICGYVDKSSEYLMAIFKSIVKLIL